MSIDTIIHEAIESGKNRSKISRLYLRIKYNPWGRSLKLRLLKHIGHWQYNPYGTRRHWFAFSWSTGHSFIYSLVASIRHVGLRRIR